MKKIFTFMLSAAALLVSVPSWAEHVYPDGTEKNFEELGLPLIEPDLHGSFFGTICVPQRIVATKGINIWDVKCVDVDPLDTTKVARLVIVAHAVCDGLSQTSYPLQATDEPFCPYDQSTSANPCNEKTYIDWAWEYGEPGDSYYEYHGFRMKAGAAYFYNVCDGIGTTAKTLADRKIWVDANDVASAPVCQNGFYGTFEQTNLNEPVTVLTQATLGEQKTQYLEQVTQVTMPANRGYFKGNFECVPWRWDTNSPNFTKEFQEKWGVSTSINPRHNPCTGEIYDDPPITDAPGRMVAFNVGRNATTGLYQVDFEHPIYLGTETNKRIENGQLIIEAADGTKYNAFGQRVK